jgi:hypothetical protein
VCELEFTDTDAHEHTVVLNTARDELGQEPDDEGGEGRVDRPRVARPAGRSNC